MSSKQWKETPMLPGWKFQHVNSPPFRGVRAKCENRGENIYSAAAYSHDLNPGNVLYYLVDDLLNFINTQDAMAEFGERRLAHGLQQGFSTERPRASRQQEKAVNFMENYGKRAAGMSPVHAAPYGMSRDQTTAVNRTVTWIPIDHPKYPCPLNTTVQLINKADGKAMYGIYTVGDTRWTHWQGAPVFED